MQNKHGGARIGAGRKPKALKYVEVTAQVEQTIVDALPTIIDKLVSMAKEGDVAAARYVVDRILGRVAVLDKAPVQDESLPYNENDFDRAIYRRVRDLTKSYREEAQWKKENAERWRAWRMPEPTSGDTLDDLKRAVDEDDRRRRMGSPPDSND